jgi:hypothetical protein
MVKQIKGVDTSNSHKSVSLSSVKLLHLFMVFILQTASHSSANQLEMFSFLQWGHQGSQEMFWIGLATCVAGSLLGCEVHSGSNVSGCRRRLGIV